MSRVFVDTSAVLALVNQLDDAHGSAKQAFAKLTAREDTPVTTSYVLVEIYALLGRRFGLEAVRGFRDDFAPLLDVVWVGSELHERGVDELLKRAKRKFTLVDVTSFLTARQEGIHTVFAYDGDFEEEGFELLQ
ncbi:MAG: type II toxin-antitoxin system VapC family toxin [Acidobacteriota bacterium]